MDKPTLRQFLVRHRAYRKFVRNFTAQRMDITANQYLIEFGHLKYAIIMAFFWEDAAEGNEYWSRLHILFSQEHNL